MELSIRQKLIIIQKLSGMTQEKLAQKFQVSFATLNSWINDKSLPRSKASQKIHDLYLEITGQKIISPEEIAAKVRIIEEKRSKFPQIIDYIRTNPDIFDCFVLSLTYHSNRIEGSTMTEPETAAVLFRNVTIPDKSLIEHLEIKNHQTAWKYLVDDIVSFPFEISEQLVLDLHRILMNSIHPDAGRYRNHSERIVGVDVPTANYLKVPFLMEELIREIQKASGEIAEIIHRIAQVHSRFEQIHPFADGNGRIGRLLIQAMALRSNLPPAIILQENKRYYYTYLNKAQQSIHEDLSLLENFVCDAFLEGFKIMERN